MKVRNNMKKAKTIILSILCVFSTFSCNYVDEDVQKAIDYYSSLTIKHFEKEKPEVWILCWRINEYEWRCGAKMYSEIFLFYHSYGTVYTLQDLLPYKLSEMKEKMKDVKDKSSIYPLVIKYHLSLDEYYDYRDNFPPKIDFTTYLYLYSQLGLPINYEYLETLI